MFICLSQEKYNIAFLFYVGHDYTVDYWAFGVVLFQMVTGELPFTGMNEVDLFRKITKCKVDFPSFLQKDVEDLLRKLLVKRKKRIGCGSDGGAEIHRHAFFKSIDWDALYRKEIEAPWKPDLSPDISGSDVSTHVDGSIFDVPLKKLPNEVNEKFEGF